MKIKDRRLNWAWNWAQVENGDLSRDLSEKTDEASKQFSLPLTGADPGFFLGGGALVSCSTSTPINHIVLFFVCRIPVVLENRRSSQGGGAHPLHPPPRSAPAWYQKFLSCVLPNAFNFGRLHTFGPCRERITIKT